MHRLLIKLIIPLLVALPISVRALPQDRTQPIEIEADHAQLDDKAGITQYKGRAILTQGTLRIEGDIITFYYDDNKQLTKAVAQGHPAKYQQIQKAGEPPVKATALQMEYYARQQKVYLLGKGHVWQNGNTFSGERIEYDIAKDIVYAGGKKTDQGKKSNKKERIHVIIQPPGQTTAPNTSGSPAPTAPPVRTTVPSEHGDRYPVATVLTHLNLRSGPGTQYQKLGTFQPGDSVSVLTKQNNWLQVKGTINGQPIIGWVYRQHIRITP